MKGDQCKFDHGNDALVLEDANAAGVVIVTVVAVFVEYKKPHEHV